MEKTLHVYVEGKVQGVFFRAETRQQAQKLGLTGWVRNLADGRVEVLASGEEDLLHQLSEWLQHGPPQAKVAHVESRYESYQAFDEFTITR